MASLASPPPLPHPKIKIFYVWLFRRGNVSPKSFLFLTSARYCPTWRGKLLLHVQSLYVLMCSCPFMFLWYLWAKRWKFSKYFLTFVYFVYHSPLITNVLMCKSSYFSVSDYQSFIFTFSLPLCCLCMSSHFPVPKYQSFIFIFSLPL